MSDLDSAITEFIPSLDMSSKGVRPEARPLDPYDQSRCVANVLVTHQLYQPVTRAKLHYKILKIVNYPWHRCYYDYRIKSQYPRLRRSAEPGLWGQRRLHYALAGAYLINDTIHI